MKAMKASYMHDFLQGYSGHVLGSVSRGVIYQSYIPVLRKDMQRLSQAENLNNESEDTTQRSQQRPSHSIETHILFLLAGLWLQDFSIIQEGLAFFVNSDDILHQSFCRSSSLRNQEAKEAINRKANGIIEAGGS